MKINLLQAHNKNIQKDYNKIFLTINLIDNSGVKYYELMQKWIKTVIPIVQGSKIVFNNKDVISELDYEKTIAMLILEYSFENQILSTKSEKEKFLDSIIGLIYDKINNLVSQNPTQYLVAVYSSFETNRFHSQAILLGLMDLNNKGYIDEENRPADEFVNSILDSIHLLNKIVPKFNFSNVYTEIESYLASEKSALEFAFNYIYSTSNISMNDMNFNSNKIIENLPMIINYFRAIHFIKYIKSVFINGLNKNNALIVNVNGSIDLNISFLPEYSKNYLDDMSHRLTPTGEEREIDKKISTVMKKYKGIDIDNCLSINTKILKNIDMPNVLLYGSSQEWIEAFDELLKGEDCNSAKLFEQLQVKSIRKLIFSSDNSIEKRIYRTPIFQIDDYFFCQASLLMNALMGTAMDFINGEIKDINIKTELENVYKERGAKFEDDVYNFLKKEYPESIVKKNIGQSQIRVTSNGNRQIVELPGEIDILMINGNNLFVIECKNIGIVTNYKKLENEYQKLVKKFQYKLQKKVAVLTENNKIVSEYFLESNTNIIENIIGCIVVSEFSAFSYYKDSKYPIVLLKNLKKFIDARK